MTKTTQQKYFIQNGDIFRVTENCNIELNEKLPPALYTIQVMPMTNELYFQRIDTFELPEKIYGEAPKYTQRILRTFKERPNSTGVLLVGLKGSGKTLQAKHLCLAAMGEEYQMPVILITRPFAGDAFNELMQSLGEAVVFIDEFEKVYGSNGDEDVSKDQQMLLTLMDGAVQTKKLFLLTANDRHKVDSHMINRPGRIYYNISYKAIEDAVVEEYVRENLKNKEHKDGIYEVMSLVNDFNFDTLKALVEEMNRYDEQAVPAAKILNITLANECAYGEYVFTVVEKETGVRWSIHGNNTNPDDTANIDAMDKNSFYLGYCAKEIMKEITRTRSVKKQVLAERNRKRPSEMTEDELPDEPDEVRLEISQKNMKRADFRNSVFNWETDRFTVKAVKQKYNYDWRTF